jgi:phenylalanyl-tRNA synthetase beta chain
VERVTGKAATVTAAEPGSLAHLHPRAAAVLRVDGETVGSFGPLHPEVVERFDLGGPALAIELDLEAVARVGRATPKFRPVPVLPAVHRDLALVVSEEVTAGALSAQIGEAAGELCESVELFDRFTGKGIAEGQQSLAFHLVFRDPKAASAPDRARTLTDQEVDELTARVIASLGERFGASVRGA